MRDLTKVLKSSNKSELFCGLIMTQPTRGIQIGFTKSLHVSDSIYLFSSSPLNDTSEVARCVLCSLLIACYIPPSNLKYPDKKIIFRRAKSSICTSALTSEVVVNCNIDSHSLYYKS